VAVHLRGLITLIFCRRVFRFVAVALRTDGGFYGKTTEARPWTMLVFLNDVAEGGHTSFPKLDMEVIPRFGDALVWSNVKFEVRDGSQLTVVDEDMVHAGKPPAREGIEKYAMNVWFGHQPVQERIDEGRWP
jgi:2OG-Fe(II) oxygenase superfamily